MSKLAQAVSSFSDKTKRIFGGKSTNEQEADVKSNGKENVATSSARGMDSTLAKLPTLSAEEEAEMTRWQTSSGPAANVTDAATTPARNGLDSAHRLAGLLQQLEECRKTEVEFRAEMKETKSELVSKINRLKRSILDNQIDLPLETQ